MILRGIIAGVLATLAVMGLLSIIGQVVALDMEWLTGFAIAEGVGALAGLVVVCALYEGQIHDLHKQLS